MSHPVWVRGLKRVPYRPRAYDDSVAPRVGAWIETSLRTFFNICCSVSHPVWVRGLKLSVVTYLHILIVAPRVGAWIETNAGLQAKSYPKVAPRVGAWIETSAYHADR